jgi:hypothetical protein
MRLNNDSNNALASCFLPDQNLFVGYDQVGYSGLISPTPRQPQQCGDFSGSASGRIENRGIYSLCLFPENGLYHQTVHGILYFMIERDLAVI